MTYLVSDVMLRIRVVILFFLSFAFSGIFLGLQLLLTNELQKKDRFNYTTQVFFYVSELLFVLLSNILQVQDLNLFINFIHVHAYNVRHVRSSYALLHSENFTVIIYEKK